MEEIKAVEETKLVVMTFDEWAEKYKPILDDDGCPRAFDTTGPDYDEVVPYPANQIWTRIDCDGCMPITNRWHYVNRDSYFITEVPFEGDIVIEVTDPFELTEEEEKNRLSEMYSEQTGLPYEDYMKQSLEDLQAMDY